jgi:hypothetical protein
LAMKREGEENSETEGE